MHLTEEQMHVLSEFLNNMPGIKNNNGNVNFNLSDLQQNHRVQLLNYVRKCLDKNAKNEKRKEKDRMRRANPDRNGMESASQSSFVQQ